MPGLFWALQVAVISYASLYFSMTIVRLNHTDEPKRASDPARDITCLLQSPCLGPCIFGSILALPLAGLQTLVAAIFMCHFPWALGRDESLDILHSSSLLMVLPTSCTFKGSSVTPLYSFLESIRVWRWSSSHEWARSSIIVHLGAYLVISPSR